MVRYGICKGLCGGIISSIATKLLAYEEGILWKSVAYFGWYLLGLGSMDLGNRANIVHGPKTFGSSKSRQMEDLHDKNLQIHLNIQNLLSMELGNKNPKSKKNVDLELLLLLL